MILNEKKTFICYFVNNVLLQFTTFDDFLLCYRILSYELNKTFAD